MSDTVAERPAAGPDAPVVQRLSALDRLLPVSEVPVLVALVHASLLARRRSYPETATSPAGAAR